MTTYQSNAPKVPNTTSTKGIPANFLTGHTLNTARSMDITATNNKSDPNKMLESGATTDHPHDPTVHAKLIRVRPSLNFSRRLGSLREAIAALSFSLLRLRASSFLSSF